MVLLALLSAIAACSEPVALGQSLASAGGQASAGSVGAPERVWRLALSTYTPPEHHVTRVLNEYAGAVDKATGGRVKITIYPNETLTTAAQTYDAVAKGVVDMGFSFFAYNPGRFPLMEVVDLPLPGVRNSTQASLEAWAVYQKFRPEELSDIKLLGVLSMAGGTLFTNKPITRLDDVAKQQIRGSGNDVGVIDALGGSPVAMPITEAYVALQKGICDGTLTDDAAMLSYHFGDVVKNKVAFPGGLRQVTAWYGMNLGVWNSMPPDIQNAITEVSTRYIKIFGESRDEENRLGARYLVQAGVRTTTLSPAEISKWQEALQPFREDYVKTKTAMGLPAKEALDYAIAALQRY